FFSVKEILQAAKNNEISHIDGAVIELISIDEAFITAIDTILGGQAQHVVCKDDQAARKAIAWLKKENKGRATFLPIASITERHIPNNTLREVKQVDGFIAIASDVITTDKTY